ncbi:PepSY domain-containing protein [Streptomyces kanasensis]|uniref:PepSY domain-containing protein n=1 Tax=Streptomyces kanasensis TaxID=936756 RepID=UPI00380E8A61
MKRNLVIATLTAAALVGGGAYTAVAAAAGDATPSLRTAAAVVDDHVGDGAADDRAEDRADRDDDAADGKADDGAGRDGDRAAPAGPVTAAQAIAAALKSTPGVVASVEPADDGTHWDVEVLGKDDREHDLRVDAAKATVTPDDDRSDDDRSDDDRSDDRGDRDDDRTERAALRSAKVNAAQATAEALRAHAGATVTGVDFDDDGTWDVELRTADGAGKETRVDAKAAPAGRGKAA